MSKRNKYGRPGGQFAWRLIEMLESPAIRVLSLWAHKVLSRIEIELAHHGGRDNGNLPVTYDDFVHYGVRRHQVAPALHELVTLGFVEITKPGRGGNAEFHQPHRFRLTYRHTARDEPTDEWRRIATMEQAAKLASELREASRQKRKASDGASGKRRNSGNGKNRIPVTDGVTTRSDGRRH